MKAIRNPAKKRPTVGERIIEGLEQAVAWTRDESDRVRVTLIEAPDVDVRDVWQRMGLSQAQFATKFGFPPATLRNWEQGRARADAPTRALLAVIAKRVDSSRCSPLRDMFDLDVAPMLFEVFGNQAAVAVVRRFLTAKQTSAVQEFARGVFDEPRTHQIEKLPLVQWQKSVRESGSRRRPKAYST